MPSTVRSARAHAVASGSGAVLLRNEPPPVTLLVLLDTAIHVVGGTTQLAALAAAALVVVGAVLWFSHAWWRALFTLGRQAARVDALEATVAELQRRTGVRPGGLRLGPRAVGGPLCA